MLVLSEKQSPKMSSKRSSKKVFKILGRVDCCKIFIIQCFDPSCICACIIEVVYVYVSVVVSRRKCRYICVISAQAQPIPHAQYLNLLEINEPNVCKCLQHVVEAGQAHVAQL